MNLNFRYSLSAMVGPYKHQLYENGKEKLKAFKVLKRFSCIGQKYLIIKNLCYSNLIFKANGEAQLGKYSGEENAAAAAESLFVANHSY